MRAPLGVSRVSPESLSWRLSRMFTEPVRASRLPPGSDGPKYWGMVEVSAAQHALYGVEPGWSFAIRHRVRWSECDPFGHANHRAYFEWFEEARNRYLEALGVALAEPAGAGHRRDEHPLSSAARLCRRN